MKSPISSFFATFSWRTGLLYGLLISLLSAYAWRANQEREQQTAFNLDCLKILNELGYTITKEGQELESQIKRKKEFSEGNNTLQYDEAQRIRKLQSTQVSFFENELCGIYPIVEEGRNIQLKDFGPLNHEVNHVAVIQALILIADSLRIWAHGYFDIIQEIDSSFGQSQLQHFRTLLSNGSTLEKVLTIKLIQINYSNICNKLLIRINEQLPKYDPWDLHTFLPILAANTNDKCIRVGKIFEADLYAVYYPKLLDHWRFRANDKTIPNVAGMGKFSQTYQTPGKKSIRLEALVTNPLTAQVDTFSREFFLEICK